MINKHVEKNIRIMFPENGTNRIQRVLKYLIDDKAKDEHVPGSLTWIGRCAVDHAAADIIEQLESRVQSWIRVDERLPENDVPVLVSGKRKAWNGKKYNVVFTAFHTDGTTHTEDSGYGWDLEDTGLKYCEETDDYIIPEAWWEDVRYGEEFSKVYDTTVTHWMPLPEPYNE